MTDAYANVMRLDCGAVIGQSVFEVLRKRGPADSGQDLAALRSSFDRASATRRPDVVPLGRLDIPTADGEGFERKHWSWLSVPILDDEGGLLWIAHRVHDMTDTVLSPDSEESARNLQYEQELLIKRLRTANEELAYVDGLRAAMLKMARLHTVAIMSSALAHDLAQPLTASISYLAVLKRTRTSNEAMKTELIEKADAQLMRAADIVNALRNFVIAGAADRRPEHVRSLIDDAVKLASTSVHACIAVDADSDLPPVFADRVQIQQVLANLVSNASEACLGCERRVIAISARSSGDWVTIDVADTGEGLNAAVADTLFQPFVTTKRDGTGLGLAICQEIVKGHGGELTALPNTPSGMVFAFTLPVAAADSE